MAGPVTGNGTTITVALFDLGGVLFDFEPRGRLAALAADCGRTEGEVHALVWGAGLSRELDEGRHTTRAWYELVRARLGLRMDFERFRDVYLGVLRPRPEMLALVDEVRRVVRTAILTDNPQMLSESMDTRFPGVADRFDALLFSSELRALKPSPEAFTRALARLEAPASAVFFVDDTPQHVAAARTLGIDAVLFTTVDDLRADLTARRLIEI